MPNRANDGKMETSRAIYVFSGENILSVDPDNTEELAAIVGEVGAEVLDRYARCQLGELIGQLLNLPASSVYRCFVSVAYWGR